MGRKLKLQNLAILCMVVGAVFVVFPLASIFSSNSRNSRASNSGPSSSSSLQNAQEGPLDHRNPSKLVNQGYIGQLQLALQNSFGQKNRDHNQNALPQRTQVVEKVTRENEDKEKNSVNPSRVANPENVKIVDTTTVATKPPKKYTTRTKSSPPADEAQLASMPHGQIISINRRHPSSFLCIDQGIGYIKSKLAPCHGKGGAQEWGLTKHNQFVVFGENLCMDASNGTHGDPVLMAECSAEYNPLQAWEFIGKFGGVIIRNLGSGLCLSPPLEFYRPKTAQNPIVLSKCAEDQCFQLWRTNLTDVQIMKSDKTKSIEQKKRTGGGKLLCWVMTNPANLATKAVAVNNTWGKFCDKLYFMSSGEPYPGLPMVLLNIAAPESRDMLWRKSIMAWMHLYNNDINDYDWFIRADDDTYVMMDNLREFLGTYDPLEPHYLGRGLLLPAENITFYSGGALNILSKTALDWLGSNATLDPGRIFPEFLTFSDDAELGISLKQVGIFAEDTRDEEGRERFFPVGLAYERRINRADEPDHWFFIYSASAREGYECCSKKWIASHYENPVSMALLDEIHVIGCEAAGYDPGPYFPEPSGPLSESKAITAKTAQNGYPKQSVQVKVTTTGTTMPKGENVAAEETQEGEEKEEDSKIEEVEEEGEAGDAQQPKEDSEEDETLVEEVKNNHQAKDDELNNLLAGEIKNENPEGDKEEVGEEEESDHEEIDEEKK